MTHNQCLSMRRRAQRKDSDIPLDIDDQNHLVKKVEDSIPFNTILKNKTTDSTRRILVRSIEIGFLFINFILVTYPYYRKVAPFYSCFACTSFLLSAILIENEFMKYHIDGDILTNINNKTLMKLNILLGLVILGFKIRTWNKSFDLVFLLPAIVAITIYFTYMTRQDLEEEATKLKAYRYNYRQV